MIPRIIHRIWIGDPEPEWQRACGRTWKQPGWDVREYDRPPFGLQNQTLYDRAEELAPGLEGQFRSDILRLELLYWYGGVYVDADFQLLQPIDDLLDVPCFLAWEMQGKWANNAIMGAEPKHRFIGRLIDYLPDSVARHQGHKPNRMTGPQYVTRMLRRWGQGVTVYDESMFYPLSWRDHDQAVFEPTLEARAVHWFHQKRQERGGVEPRV